MPLPPLRFAPILKSRAWGGRSLAQFGKPVPPVPAPPTGESWEIADLAPPVEDGVSRVRGGPFDGRSLSQLIDAHRAAMLGRSSRPGERFPLLVKYLDAAENLSVQVHPTAAYAARHPGSHLKTEAWFVLHAQPGALIYRGLRPDVTPAVFRCAIEDGTAVECLVQEAVRPGDCIPLESGLCHALGAGVLVAEVQTPSDTTFRVYDWSRNDPARPLHVEQAMDCILFGAEQRLAQAPITGLERANAPWSDGLRTALLCRNAHFAIEAVEASPSGDAAPISCSSDGAPCVLMLVRGEAVMESEGHRPERLAAGDTVLLPADLAATAIDLSPGAVMLQASTAGLGIAPDGPRAGERSA
ncbi:MAG: type I phosphomannose isomerase catalytic subunit [Planctomycetota bacterium]